MNLTSIISENLPNVLKNFYIFDMNDKETWKFNLNLFWNF